MQKRTASLSCSDVHRLAVEVHPADRPGDRPEQSGWGPRLGRGFVAVAAIEDAHLVEGDEQTGDREDQAGDRTDDVARAVQERAEPPARSGIGRLVRGLEIVHGETQGDGQANVLRPWDEANRWGR